MLKKLSITFGLLLVTLTSVGYFYYKSWQRDVKRTDIIPYILESSVFVCDFQSVGKQWEHFRETAIGQDFSMLPFFTGIQPSLEFLKQSGIDKNLLDEIPLVVSIHGLSEEEIGYIFYLDLRNANTNFLLEFLENQKKNNKCSFDLRTYAGYTITSISQPKVKNAKTVYMLRQGNYVMFSFSELLIEDIVRGLAYKEPAAFIPVKKTSYKQGSLLINFPKLPSLLRVFLKQEYNSKLGSQLANALPAAQVELKLTNHYLLLNGLVKNLLPLPDKFYWIDTLTKEEPSTFRLAPYIPANSALVQCYTFKDPEMFADAIYLYRNNQNEAQTSSSKKNRSLKQLINQLLKNDIALCTLGPDLVNQLLFVHINNVERTVDVLEEVKLITGPAEQQINNWSTIYAVNQSVFKDWLPSAVFQDFVPKLLTIVDNHIILANSFSALKQLHEAYVQNNTWANENGRQQKFLASTLASANFSMFVNMEYAWSLVTQRLKPAWKAIVDKYVVNFKKYGYASFQFVNAPQVDQQPRYINILLAHIADDELPTHVAPATLPALQFFQTATPVTSKLFFVDTHKKDAPHLLVQDASYQLYFIDNLGRLVWKRKLEGPILTEILPVDIYKNNKWQYVCATSDYLHIIDYTGQDVNHYPQRLPQPGKDIRLNIVDYNHDKNYRILITDSKGNIYLRDTQYRPLPGWNPKSLHIPFAMTPFHLRVNKDYFVSLQTNGTLYALTRRAQVYNGFPIKIQEAVYNPLVVQKGASPSTTRLVVLTEEGKLYFYNLSGTLQNKIQLEKTDYTAKFIMCPERDGGNVYTIIRQDLNKVAVLDEQGRLIFEKEQEAEQNLIYDYYVFGAYKFYVITDPVKKKTYIYNTLGKTVNNIPLDNSGQETKLSFTEATRQLIVYTAFNKSILKYELTIEDVKKEDEDSELSNL
jgi:hypothetical protein